jgi:hypothetical protein
MDHNRYQVIYKGEFLDGSNPEKAYRTAAAVLSVSETKARQLLNGQRVVLKKGLDETSARGMCIALKQAGIRVALGVPETNWRMPAGLGQLGPRPARRSFRCLQSRWRLRISAGAQPKSP